MEKLKQQSSNIIIFVLWLLIVLITALYHEPWADEAQSWLIARDNSFFNIIFSDVLNHEGHPALWYFILKIAIYCGLPYSYIFVLPLLFTAIGMYLFIFKSKLNNIIKVLFPFTFYVIFQYSVIARNHSLVFPILALIAVVYKNRLLHPIIYSILLILLMNVSAHSYAIAGILFLFFCFDVFKNQKTENITNKKNIFCLLIIFFSFVLTACTVLPMPYDLVRAIRTHIPDNFLLTLLEPLVSGYFLDNTHNITTYIKSVLILMVYVTAFFTYCKTRQQKTLFIILPLVLLTTMSKIYYMYWHSGYVIILFIFVLWILADENNLIQDYNGKLKKIFYIGFSLLLSIQMYYGIKTVILDINNPYCGSKSAAQFIKEKGFEKYPIIGIGIKSVALQPYFSKNLYTNFKQSYWGWNIQHYEENQYNIEKTNFPIIIIDYYQKDIIQKNEFDKIKQEYQMYGFPGNMYMSGTVVEPNIIVICVKKDI